MVAPRPLALDGNCGRVPQTVTLRLEMDNSSCASLSAVTTGSPPSSLSSIPPGKLTSPTKGKKEGGGGGGGEEEIEEE